VISLISLLLFFQNTEIRLKILKQEQFKKERAAQANDKIVVI
jgi:hypothetical protein